MLQLIFTMIMTNFSCFSGNACDDILTVPRQCTGDHRHVARPPTHDQGDELHRSGHGRQDNQGIHTERTAPGLILLLKMKESVKSYYFLRHGI